MHSHFEGRSCAVGHFAVMLAGTRVVRLGACTVGAIWLIRLSRAVRHLQWRWLATRSLSDPLLTVHDCIFGVRCTVGYASALKEDWLQQIGLNS
jgi:hypothetical protein